jgi:hypothetical protein
VVGHAVFDRQIFGQRVAQAHVHRALELALAQRRIDHAPDVVGGHELLDPTVAVEDAHLGGVAEGGVGLDLAGGIDRARRGGVVDLHVGAEHLADQLGQRAPGVEGGPQLGRRADHGVASEQRGPRAGGLGAAEGEGRVDLGPEDRGRQPGDLGGELRQHGQEPCPISV